jgi:hypothetical protein
MDVIRFVNCALTTRFGVLGIATLHINRAQNPQQQLSNSFLKASPSHSHAIAKEAMTITLKLKLRCSLLASSARKEFKPKALIPLLGE